MSDTPVLLPASTLVAASGRDTDTAIASLAGLYAGRSWYARPVDENFWFKYVGVGDDLLSVRRSQMHGYLRGDVATESEVVVQWLERGGARVDVAAADIHMRPGVPVMFPADRRFEFEYQDWDQRLVHVRRDLLLEVAAEQHVVAGPLAFDHQVEPDGNSSALWRNAVAGAVRALQAGGPSSLVWHEAQRNVARSLLHLYPLHTEMLPIGRSSHSDHRLRAAVEYIHAHAAERVVVQDIADAAGLSIRGVQDAFHRSLDRAPLSYLREVRLTRVHEELRTLDPGTTRISDVARRWGFSHMGRFSAAYADCFGEYPRQTLRRS
ncbi:hypothetical protein BIU95_06915 [Curtobacterium sp. MCBA15_007]|uniref:AraC family transcriptional regulator n=1 Tax=Curtobacterium TaxID=2034 RepID=UPI0008DCDDE1|nr:MULTISPECIES: helix-turn-helix domain-containing protein [Curtobacterium]OII01411.1 hypothetical protein BIU95_06915 [Curtobacterium sp. MCBA15_007]